MDIEEILDKKERCENCQGEYHESIVNEVEGKNLCDFCVRELYPNNND